jgi:hypothetical protein
MRRRLRHGSCRRRTGAGEQNEEEDWINQEWINHRGGERVYQPFFDRRFFWKDKKVTTL